MNLPKDDERIINTSLSFIVIPNPFFPFLASSFYLLSLYSLTLHLNMPSSAPASPTPSSPTSSAILSPSSKLTLSSDLSAASPRHIYKLSSQYFLTKHFPEASVAIQPLLRTSDQKWQQKAWALYIIILDNGLKLSHEEGRKVWGRQAWDIEISRVKSGKIWDELLDSVQGIISSIDAEVVMALYRSLLMNFSEK